MSKLSVCVDYIKLVQWLNMIKFYLDHDEWQERKMLMHMYADRIIKELDRAALEAKYEADQSVGVPEE